MCLFIDNVLPFQGLVLELDDEMVADDADREALQDIINNVKLSEGYLTLARDIEVMEPKSPEDIYKVLAFVCKLILPSLVDMSTELHCLVLKL